MRILLAGFMLFLASPAFAQGIVVPAQFEIFDGPSGTTSKQSGRLIVDQFYEARSPFQLQMTGGKVLCSGTRIHNGFGGTFTGKCLGYPARGTYAQSANGWVDMKWTYSNSWIKLRAKVQ